MPTYRVIKLVIAFVIISTLVQLAVADEVKIKIKQIFFIKSELYPSKNPLCLLRVNFDIGETTKEEDFKRKLENARWIILVNRDNNQLKLGDAIARIDLSFENTLAYLHLRSGALMKDDEIVGLEIDDIRYKEEKPQKVPDLISKPIFQIDPKQVSDQELIDGTKKDVYQFGIKLDIPTIGILKKYAHVYIKSDNLLSTEGKDKNTKIEFKLGAERSLSDKWFWPGFIDAEYIGNQIFSNESFVATAGTKSILPWYWTQSFLWNDYIKAPISPFITIGLQYEDRIKKDPLVDTSHAKDNLFRINAQFEWNPIHLLTGKDYSPKDVSLGFIAQLWYFPDEQAMGGATAKQLESHYNVVLYIPINAPDTFYSKPKDRAGTQTRLKMEYDTGANEANGFVRSSSVKFGFEINK